MNGNDFNFETDEDADQSDSSKQEHPVIVFNKELDSLKSIGIQGVQSGNINITRLIQHGLKMARTEMANKRFNNRTIEMPDDNMEIHIKELPIPHKPASKKVREMTQNILVKSRTLNDTISILQIDSAYKKALVGTGIQANFTIKRDSLFRPDKIAGEEFSTSKVPIGFLSKNAYQASFDAPTAFLLRKIAPQVLLSLFLVAFTLLTFMFLYRNLLAQRKLGAMKNDFISNITHELKTPIATVNVAIEALRNFNALDSPARTKEYLDISAAELQRLSLLVDKVLKLSMFESKDIELQKEQFNLKELISEVMLSMRLQFEKNKASINFKTAGEPFDIYADRLHLTSVIYNLLDNALKYSKGKPDIKVDLASLPNEFILRVQDNGIGISQEYATKIFEKFFRVPSGDHHNIKGYGLGLSYAAQVVQKHGGTISVETKAAQGATFIIKLPST